MQQLIGFAFQEGVSNARTTFISKLFELLIPNTLYSYSIFRLAHMHDIQVSHPLSSHMNSNVFIS